MTWRLRDFPDVLAAGAAQVAEVTDIPMAHVEKDFWITEVLRGVARCSADTEVSAVFKGGTSLSKAFGLIQRFSEDVDVIVMAPGHSKGEDDRCLKSFVDAAASSTGLEAVIDSSTATRGVKRTAKLQYPTNTAIGALQPSVLLELGTRGGAMPTVRQSVSSLLVEHGHAAGLETDFVEAEPVTVHTLAPVRTLIEKLIIVHHAATLGDETEQARLARHYYDIWCLLNDHDTVEALKVSPADVLAREVVTFTAATKMDTSPRPVRGFASSPAFDPATCAPAKDAFASIVIAQLVWPTAPHPSFEDCCEAVQEHKDVL